MLLKPKSIRAPKEEFENKLLIEKWMKRNSSGSVTIGKDPNKPDDSIKKLSKTPSKGDFSTTEIEISVQKVMRAGQDSLPKNPIVRSNVMQKRLHSSSTDNSVTDPKKQKLFLYSLSKTNTEQLVKKSNSPKIVNTKPEANLKSKTQISKNLPINVQHTKVSQNKVKENVLINSKQTKISSNIVKNLPFLVEQTKVSVSSALKNSPTKIEQSKVSATNMPGTKNVESDANSKNHIKSVLSKEKDPDVYVNLLENYRYLITPKAWSVTEYISGKDRYIVFSNAHVVKEDDTLISVIRKSLIIDKGSTMNYSVHGLPIDIKGTILPRTLDNTKKLLSILHIFDKMQVCEGLGSDLNLSQTDVVFKDNCRYWRHKHCKIILIKAIRCPICTETRNLLLERKKSLKKKL